MKSFVQHLKEFAIKSTSTLVFEVGSQGLASSALKIPISGPMFKRIWPDTIRATVFHTTDAENIYDLKKLEGKKKSISAFFSMTARQMEHGIASGGGVVAELDADVLVSARDDIMSQVDKAGRRWVEMSWFENQASRGLSKSGFQAVERELNVLIRNLVLKHLEPIMGNKARTEPEFYLWADMKRHLKDGKKLSLVIKDYYDGVEVAFKKNSKVMGKALYDYAKNSKLTDDAWDEQVVNNIKVKTAHFFQLKLLRGENSLSPEQVELIEFAESKGWSIKMWDAAIELEAYTRAVAKKELGK